MQTLRQFLPSHNSKWSDDDKRAWGKEGDRVGRVPCRVERRGGHVLLFSFLSGCFVICNIRTTDVN